MNKCQNNLFSEYKKYVKIITQKLALHKNLILHFKNHIILGIIQESSMKN